MKVERQGRRRGRVQLPQAHHDRRRPCREERPGQPHDALSANLLSPIVLAFALGAVATLIRSNLKIPDALYESLSIYFLLAIGFPVGLYYAVAAPNMSTTDLSWFVDDTVTRALIERQRWSSLLALPDTTPVIRRFGAVACRRHLLPQVVVEYDRRPYIGRRDYRFRVTLDSRLRATCGPALDRGAPVKAHIVKLTEARNPWQRVLFEVYVDLR